jgi:hypothetical protein
MTRNIVVNIRGPSGAGKTTLVRTLMERYGPAVPIERPGMKRYEGYQLGPNLRVVGDYRRKCGGAEGMRDANLERTVREFAQVGHVIFEGLFVSSSVGRWRDLARDLGNVTFAFLRPPLHLCINRVHERRAAAGTTRPFDPRHVKGLWRRLPSHFRQFEAMGAQCLWLLWADPLPELAALLGLPPVPVPAAPTPIPLPMAPHIESPVTIADPMLMRGRETLAVVLQREADLIKTTTPGSAARRDLHLSYLRARPNDDEHVASARRIVQALQNPTVALETIVERVRKAHYFRAQFKRELEVLGREGPRSVVETRSFRAEYDAALPPRREKEPDFEIPRRADDLSGPRTPRRSMAPPVEELIDTSDPAWMIAGGDDAYVTVRTDQGVFEVPSTSLKKPAQEVGP